MSGPYFRPLSEVWATYTNALNKAYYDAAVEDIAAWASENQRLLLIAGCIALPTSYYLYGVWNWVTNRRKLNRELHKFQGLSTHWLKGSLHHVIMFHYNISYCNSYAE